MQIQQNIQTLRQTLQRALADSPDDLLTAHALLDAMWLEAETVDRQVKSAEDLTKSLRAIVKHQDMIGGTMATLSTTQVIAANALRKAGVDG